MFNCWVQEWRSAGVDQLRLSTVDLTGVPSLQNLQRGVDFALRHRERGTSVYVHCKAGRSRSATLVAAYLIKVSGSLSRPEPEPGQLGLAGIIKTAFSEPIISLVLASVTDWWISRSSEF